ncbi:hypothetical protein J7K18_01815 [bacterium]|nr:hypothetical protein [bacterium]
MRTLIQVIILFVSPIVVYRAVPTRSWWGALGIVAFVFTFFWTRHAKVGRQDRFVRQVLFSLLITGAITAIFMYFSRM